MTPASTNTRIGDKILDIEKHALPFLRQVLAPGLVFYLSANPHTAAVLLIEYFKIDPPSALLAIQLGFPALIGVSIARVISIWWFAVFQYIFAGFLLAFLILPLLLLRLLAPLSFYTLSGRASLIYRRFRKRQALKRKFFLHNQIIAAMAIALLYWAEFVGMPYAANWNPKYNRELVVVAHLHYYCQVTGGYNQDICEQWKHQLARLRRVGVIREIFYQNVVLQ